MAYGGRARRFAGERIKPQEASHRTWSWKLRAGPAAMAIPSPAAAAWL